MSHRYASANLAVTAAGAGDNTAQTGVIIDRTLCGYPQRAYLVFAGVETMAATKTLTLKSVIIEHGDDSGLSDAATLCTCEDSTGHVIVTAGASGDTAVPWVKEYELGQFAGCKRYFRAKWTIDLSATSTDTATVAAIFHLAGIEYEPQT